MSAARVRRPVVDGLLLLDKPAGISSHDAVLRARRATGERRIGHAGTLDPFATGLLVVLLGRATRLLPWLPGEPKVYAATIRFGLETDTDDLLGAPVREATPPDPALIPAAMRQLTGPIDQLPPAFSAKRIDGERAYAIARRGDTPALTPSRITVHEWTLGAWHENQLDVRIVCSGGTYIRALARDVGRLTGSAAHLVALRRVASGPFDVSQAVAVEALDDTVAVRPPRDALPQLPAVPLTDDEVRRAIRGLTVGATAEPDGTRAALVAPDGQLVAAAMAKAGQWWPRVVMWVDDA